MIFGENPFFLLDASPRDSKKTLRDKAENKSFELPEEVCRSAERVLLTPKKRIEAEISWFPGMSSKKIKNLLTQISETAKTQSYNPDLFDQFHGISKANAIAFFLSASSGTEGLTQERVEEIVRDFCEATEKTDINSTLSAINEDRIASGVPEIADAKWIEAEFDAHFREYKKLLHAFLDEQESSVIIDTLTHLIEDNTVCGDLECAWDLLDDIITDYEMDAAPFFEKQEKKLDADLADVQDELDQRKTWPQMQAKFKVLSKDVLLWNRIAQPIQILMRSKGSDHKRSEILSNKLRAFAVSAHNNHGYTELAMKITELQGVVFSALRSVTEVVADDKKQLQDILRHKTGGGVASASPE